MQFEARWRNGCVVRARTVAAELRLVEIAVEGSSEFRSRMAVQMRLDRATGLRAYTCQVTADGRITIAVRRERDDPASAFMWALVEGARMRIAPLRPAPDRHRAPLAGGETCGGPAAARASDAMASARVTYRTRMHLSVAYIQIGRATQRPAANVRRNAEFGVRELQWEDLR